MLSEGKGNGAALGGESFILIDVSKGEELEGTYGAALSDHVDAEAFMLDPEAELDVDVESADWSKRAMGGENC